MAAIAVACVPTTHSCQLPFTGPAAQRGPGHVVRKARTAPVSAIQATAVTTPAGPSPAGPSPASRAVSTLAAAGKAKKLNSRSGRFSSPRTSGPNAATRQADDTTSTPNATTATQSRTADGTALPASRSATDTIPVAITMAKQRGSAPRITASSPPERLYRVTI